MDEESKRLFEEREQSRQQAIEGNKRDSVPVLADLTAAGFQLKSVDDLYSKRMDYRNAIPILLKWMPFIENLDVKGSIVRALTVPWAKPMAAPALLAEFHKMENESDIGIKWEITNALEVVADDKSYNEIVNLVRDPKNGSSRKMLALALGKLKNPNAQDVLIELLDDDLVAGHAIMALGKLRSKKAYTEIERFLTHPRTWVRNEAKKALARIDKAQNK